MREIYRKLLDLLDRRGKRRLALLLLMILVMGVLEVVGVGSILPFLAILSRPESIHENEWLAAAYDLGGYNDDHDFLLDFGLLVLFLILFSLAFKSITLYAVSRFSYMRGHNLSMRMFSGYIHQPYVWFLNRHSAGISTVVLGEVQQVIMSIMIPGIQLLAYLLTATLLISLIMAVDPIKSLIAVSVIVSAYAMLFLFIRQLLSRIGLERRKANHARFLIVQEATGGIKDIKIMGLENTFVRRLHPPSYNVAHYQSLTQVLGDIPRPILEAALFGGMLLLVLQMMLSSSDNLQDIIPFVGLYAFAGLRLFPALQQIYQTLTVMRSNKPALDALHADLLEVEAMDPTVRQSPTQEPLSLNKTLELRNVHYVYPKAAHPALNGADLTIQARTTIGLVGSTGAGKTTVVDVILGLLVPHEGTLVIDGREISTDAERTAWRKSIGYVPQQVFLSDDTVAANIAFGMPHDRVDRAAVERAARTAELHDFVVRDLAEGYDARVGERGVRLSGGQRQRIGIARALYHDPDVIVLDEATSALDNLTERAVMEAVRNLGRVKTVIMIAHRLSTVRQCDEIFLMENGRVAASGPYDRLLQENAVFRRMAEGAT